MRKNIKMWILLCLVSTFALFPGCRKKAYQYSFDQPFSNVVKVELCKYHYADHPKDDYVTPVTELDLEKADALLKDLSELQCYKHFGDHSTSYGKVILYITYANGEAEAVGIVNSASVDTDGEWWPKVYYFDSAQWNAVLRNYVDSKLVPELDEYME